MKINKFYCSPTPPPIGFLVARFIEIRYLLIATTFLIAAIFIYLLIKKPKFAKGATIQWLFFGIFILLTIFTIAYQSGFSNDYYKWQQDYEEIILQNELNSLRGLGQLQCGV